ncbi:YcaO-like family protein [Vibrio sp. Of7-15]|uniref:YcaO-like family protein n=1 Tax=Vibrio sp. Of7-15 TaxID=2724879 RepID=UPI001EF2E12B|nr:YcaO-like family protein [Vibrio sp. Of7-15]MCG7499804.1 YcaO-like family protein [Vibrio sp. Of7-15]
MFSPNLRNQAFLDTISKVCSDKVGIISPLEKLSVKDGLYITRCHSNSGISLLSGRASDIVSCGNDRNLNLSSIKVAAEYFERYCWYNLSIYRGREKESWQQLSQAGKHALSPDVIMNAFTEEQYLEPVFPLKKLGLSDQVYWLEAQDLYNQNVYLPAQLFVPPNTGEAPYWSPNSSGMAFHTEVETALLNSLLELVERDAFLHIWWSKSSPAVISQCGNRSVLDITGRIGVPCVAVVEIHQGHMLIGTSADFIQSKAIEKASAEVDQLKIVSALHHKESKRKKAHDIKSFEDSLSYYSDENLHLTDFLTQGGSAEEKAETNIGTLSALVSRLKELKIRVYTANLTTPEIAAVGGVVLKSYSPDLISLNHDDVCRPLATIKRNTGHCAAHRDPHPFL